MEDVAIAYARKPDSELETSHSGTRLELEGLRRIWNQEDWRRLRKELQNLVTPFRKIKGFKIIANAVPETKGWKNGEVASLFEVESSYKYSFELSKGGQLKRVFSRPKKIAKEVGRRTEEPKSTRVGKPSFGAIDGEFYYVLRPSVLTKQEMDPGVSIYRDGFRVEPYARPSDDWLGVKAKKASRQGHAAINPSRLAGFIEISRRRNPKLIDVTNREGLLNSQEFLDFQAYVKAEFEYFAGIIEGDKEALEQSTAYLGQKSAQNRDTRSETFANMSRQMAHQLSQPLNHIRIAAKNLRDLLVKKGMLDEGSEQQADIIERNVLRMDKSITDLRSFSEGLTDEVVEFDLGQFAREAAERHKVNFRKMDVRVELLNCDDGHRIKFSVKALNLTVDNLLDNALKAALNSGSNPPRVILNIEETATKKCMLTVSDNGMGVRKEYRSKLFKELIGIEQGHGMGLYWSRQWIEHYGGSLDYEDAIPSGARFIITF